MSESSASTNSRMSLGYRSLPSEDREAQLFWRMRYSVARATMRQLFVESRLRSILVVLLSAVFWFGLFALFYTAFQFIVEQVGSPGSPYHAKTIKLLFHLFFASLNVMLVFSSGVILYSTVFRSPDVKMLLTLPSRTERITLHKFQEATLFSSWGFFLLASPMMLAYGMVLGAPWWYYAMILPLILAFVYIPCAAGAILCMLIVAKLPKLKVAFVLAMATCVILLAAHSIWQTVSGPQSELFGNEWFDSTVERFEITQNELLPSSWLSNSLLNAAIRWDATSDATAIDHPLTQSCLYLILLVSNALVLHLVVVWTGRNWLRAGFDSMTEQQRRRTTSQVATIDWLIDRSLQWFSPQIRLQLVKDWRLLRRDPVQWTQFLVSFGLLGLYFLNIDRFRNPANEIHYTWINFVSFLNLAVVGLIHSTFTTRFIFPMISLEGQRFWILVYCRSIAGQSLEQVRVRIAGVVDSMRTARLGERPHAARGNPCRRRASVFVSTSLPRLASIAVGLGAMMPDFRETSPSKIAAGFGGTISLVLSALYIIVIVILTALPCHFYLIADRNPFHTRFLQPGTVTYWLFGGMAAAALLGAFATIYPLRRGIRAFNSVELS